MRATPLFIVCAAALLVSAPASAGKKNKKKKGDDGPVTGWHKKESWGGECYFPPDWEELGAGDKRMQWQDARQAVMAQLNGSRPDALSIDEITVTNIETALLSKPERIEAVSAKNLELCKDAMSGKGPAAWESWARALYANLTEGECPHPPLDYTLFDYLNIGQEWQVPVKVCKNDHFWIKASSNDYYRISDDGPWINADGDPAQAAAGSLPCNIEGCFKGQLIMRFRTLEGVEVVKPVGTQLDYIAPEHGTVHVMINDDTWYDNVFKVDSGIEHHTSIEYSPYK